MSNELDRQIGEKLNNYESAVDTEALWKAVQPPRRRRPWAWLMLLFLIGMGTALWLVPNEEATNAGVIADTGAEAPSGVITPELPSAVSGNTTTSANAIDNREKGSATDLSEPTNNMLASETAQAEGMNSSEKPNANLATSLSIAAQTDMVKEGKIQSVDTKSSANVTVDITSDKYKNASSIPLEEDKMDGVENLDASTLISTPSIAKSELKENSAIDLDREKITELATIATLAFEVTYTRDPAFEALTTTELNSDLPPRRRDAKQQWFIQADAAYLFPQRDLAAGTLTDSTWLNDRENREEMLEAISANLSLGIRLENGWQLRTGLGYTQINWLFSDNFTTETIDTMNGLQMLIYGAGNTVDSVFGPVAFYETTRREKKTYNSFRQWEVPIIAGYNFDLGAMDLLLEGGVRVQLNRSWEGEIRYGEEGLQDLSTKDWYRSGLALSLQGGIQIAYPLSEHLDVLAGGSVRYSLQDFSKDTSPFKERYQLLGGQVSLRYRF